MILGGHAIISARGFWLPNDQRGSWSDFVRSWELLRFGRATQVETTRSVARRPYDRARRAEARASLKYPPVTFNGIQARAIASGFAYRAAHSGCVVHACSIMPEHVHILFKRHAYRMEHLINLFKGRASYQLRVEGLHPLKRYPFPDGALPSPWSHGHWIVYINDEKHFREAVKYVRDNPLKEGKRIQRWKFVTPYRGV